MTMRAARPRARSVLFATALAAAGLLPQICSAQSVYPDRPIRIVVPFPPGGPADATTRLLGREMQATLGQPVVIENRPGAAGSIGINFVARSVPDGYTLGISGVGPTILLRALDSQYPYEPLKDLAFVGGTGLTELMFVAGKHVPASSMQELLALARERSGQGRAMTYASTGQGGPIHLAFENLKLQAKVDLLHVPYKGDPQQLQDLMAGQVDMALFNPAVVAQEIESGRITPIALASATRSKVVPTLPTASESGLPGFEANVFTLLVAPAGTPDEAIDKLNAALRAALKEPKVQQQYEQMAMRPLPLTPQETRKFVETETDRWLEIVRRTGIGRLR